MDIWGERFARVSLFIGYCRDLNVKTSQDELEHYERIGVMLPIARVVYPDEYVIQRDQNRWNGVMDWDATDQWPALARLSERIGPFPFGYEDLTDEELVHCFDREMEAGDNPYLKRPASAEFRPWSDYSVLVPDRCENKITSPTVEHYYSYWQVHQLSWIQQYTDLYKNAWLIERIPEDDPVRRYLPRAPKNERLVEFDDKRDSFDALSFWVTVYYRERCRTFAGIDETNGIRRLDDAQADAYRMRLINLARNVTACFQLTPEGLYSFLRQLIELMEDYERKERYKLVEVSKRDIFAWENLLMLTTGKTRDEVAEELGKINIYDKRTFRHLDIMTKEHDYALKVLNSIAKDCGSDLWQLCDSQWSFTKADTNELLNFCEQNGIGLFMTALSGMVAIDDEEHRRNFRSVQRYTNLKNVLTSYEYLLKNLAQGAGLVVGREPLTQLVDKVMAQETWYKLFDTKKQQGMLNGNNVQEFLTKLGALLNDGQLTGSLQGYWAQKFLVMCLARNMTVHSYPSEDSYYGDLFGPMLNAVIIATFYTWQFAKARGWT